MNANPTYRCCNPSWPVWLSRSPRWNSDPRWVPQPVYCCSQTGRQFWCAYQFISNVTIDKSFGSTKHRRGLCIWHYIGPKFTIVDIIITSKFPLQGVLFAPQAPSSYRYRSSPKRSPMRACRSSGRRRAKRLGKFQLNMSGRNLIK